MLITEVVLIFLVLPLMAATLAVNSTLDTPDHGILPNHTSPVSNLTEHNDTIVEGRQLFDTLSRPSLPLFRIVAFSARKARGSLQAFTHIHFRDVLTNVGGGWDHATSEFVAPYNGGYYFSFHAVGARNSDFTIGLTRNGVYQVTAYGTEPSFEHGSNSVFLQLRRLDRISLDLQQGSIYEHPGDEAYTTFTGFLLFSL
ncbi:cerebellin-2-like [Cherax quadricarinatus]|uniref:cerebellin-2-like n=1 Tax=Cherax quadricarinatus TaxID=27406 RepID=UPI00387E2C55